MSVSNAEQTWPVVGGGGPRDGPPPLAHLNFYIYSYYFSNIYVYKFSIVKIILFVIKTIRYSLSIGKLQNSCLFVTNNFSPPPNLIPSGSAAGTKRHERAIR